MTFTSPRLPIVLIAVVLLALFGCNHAERPTIQNLIERTVEGFNGRVGVYVRHLETGKSWGQISA